MYLNLSSALHNSLLQNDVPFSSLIRDELPVLFESTYATYLSSIVITERGDIKYSCKIFKSRHVVCAERHGRIVKQQHVTTVAHPGTRDRHPLLLPERQKKSCKTKSHNEFPLKANAKFPEGNY